jgi:hypothetical protein
MLETSMSGLMSGDGNRDGACVSTRAHPRLYPDLCTESQLLEVQQRMEPSHFRQIEVHHLIAAVAA